MEPLSKEEIEELEQEARLSGPWIAGVNPIPLRTQRLFYTARLGAEFVQQTQKKGEHVDG